MTGWGSSTRLLCLSLFAQIIVNYVLQSFCLSQANSKRILGGAVPIVSGAMATWVTSQLMEVVAMVATIIKYN